MPHLVIKTKLKNRTNQVFFQLPEFAVKNPKCNIVPRLQVHFCVLCQALAVDKCTILGGVFQSQGLGIKFIRATYESQTNHPTSFCSIIHVSIRNPSFKLSLRWKRISCSENQLNLKCKNKWRGPLQPRLHAKHVTS